MKIITQPVLIIQLKFKSKEISLIKNGYAIQGIKARNSFVTTMNNVISVKIDKRQFFKGM